MTTTGNGASSESERIGDAYGRRKNADRYSFLNKAHLLSLQETERSLLDALGRHLGQGDGHDLAQMRALDVGCGGGYWLRRMIDWGVAPGNIHGLDLLPNRVERARERLPATCDIRRADGQAIPWPDGHFDLVSQFVMFSSVLSPEVRAAIAAEMMRVTAPGGCILWYDFHVDNPRNPDVKAVRAEEVARLFPGFRVRLRRVNLAPPLARALLPDLRVAYEAARMIPWLRTHDAGLIYRPRSV